MDRGSSETDNPRCWPDIRFSFVEKKVKGWLLAKSELCARSDRRPFSAPTSACPCFWMLVWMKRERRTLEDSEYDSQRTTKMTTGDTTLRETVIMCVSTDNFGDHDSNDCDLDGLERRMKTTREDKLPRVELCLNDYFVTTSV